MKDKSKVTPDGLRIVYLKFNQVKGWDVSIKLNKKDCNDYHYIVNQNENYYKAEYIFNMLSSKRECCNYTNWDTFIWDVTIDNNRTSYDWKIAHLKDTPVTIELLKLCEQRFRIAHKEPGMDLDLVDWHDIVNSWEVERLENLEYEEVTE